VDILLQDIRYAARKLLRSPGFTCVVVGTLALAIGATTAVFSIVNSVLLEPLPIRAPGEVVAIGVQGRDANTVSMMSAPDYLDYRARNHSFSGTAVIDRNNANLSIDGGSPVRLTTLSVGASFFDILGVPLERGRGFIDGEDKLGAPHVVVLSDKVWRNQFAADPKILGRTITIDGAAFTVVGVAPRALTYPMAVDAWMPLVFEDWMVAPDNRGAHWLTGIARLRPGVTVDAAKRDMLSISEALRQEYPESNATVRAAVVPLEDTIVGGARGTLYTMLGAVGFVLLIACANIANLLLIRASTRESEMALRTALGAGRGRIMRQLITESVLLAVAGAAIGAAIAAWGVDFVVTFAPRGLPRATDIAIDGRPLAFTAGLALFTGVLFGLVPALYAARPELAQMLRDSGRSASARRASGRARASLVVVEVALSVILLVGAGLLIRSYMRLMAIDPGFRPEHVISFNVNVPDLKYPFDRDKNRFADRVVDALRQLPGTQAVAVSLTRPMQEAGMRTSFDIEGRPAAPANARLVAAVRPVTADYFSVLGIPLRAGRLFTRAEDGFGPPPVVVVSEAFVQKYFPNESPIGKRITLGLSHDTAEVGKTSVAPKGEIVGVVADVKQNTLRESPYPAVYLPQRTFPLNAMSFVIRSTAEPSTIAAEIRRRVADVDAELPIYDLETMTDAISGSIAQPRFYTSLLTGFAGLALLLAALGIYGVISYSVAQRGRELGIRIALGATNDRIVRLVVGQGLGLVLAGIVLGVVGSIGLMRLLASLLYEVRPTDLPTFLIVPIALAIVAALASWLPARRAASIDPAIAMRAD
jgi:predicted permease